MIVAGGTRRAARARAGVRRRAGDARDADVVIEATGKPKGWRDAVQRGAPRRHRHLLQRRRRASIELDAERIHYDELTLRGVFHHTPQTVRAALAFLASGAYPWGALLDARGLARALPAFFAEPPDGYLKAIVRP